jgi:F0F1-type ATP synthase membrane subunit c/vacuolar-type H+-ATPase subunit K
MAEVQQQSLQNQIQLVKNALQAPFLMSEKMGEGQEYINSFAQQLHAMVASFEALIVVEEDGVKKLTEFGEFMRKFVIVAMKELQEVLGLVVGLVKSFGDQSQSAAAFVNMLTIPIKIMLKLLTALGPEFLTTLLIYGKLNQVLPINSMYMYNNIQLRMLEIEMLKKDTNAIEDNTVVITVNGEAVDNNASQQERYISTVKRQIATQMAMKLIMFSMIYITRKYAKDSAILAGVIGGLAGMFMGLAFAINAAGGAVKAFADPTAKLEVVKAMAVGAIMMGTFNVIMQKMMSGAYDVEEPQFTSDTFDLGGRILPMYATGGRARPGQHFPIMVEPGETITSKTQNMLGGGITLNMGDVYANDAEDFAERVAEALPLAMRRQNDMGAI